MNSTSPGLQPRDRRAIAIGLAVLALALFLVLGVKPYSEALAATHDRLVTERALLVRERALIADAQTEAARERAALDTAVVERSERLFAGEATLAAGALIRYLADVASASRVLLEATETAGTEIVGPDLVAVRVRIRSIGDIEGLLWLLARLEDGPRLVRVEQIAFERRAAGYGPIATPPEQEVQVISLDATVLGYTRRVP